MVSLDIFEGDAFSLVQLTAALDKTDHKPNFLGTLDLFEPEFLRGTDVAMIEKRDNVLSLIKTSERGAPPEQRKNEKRDVRPFKCKRIYESDTIQASELFKIRAFGTETELSQVQMEIARRMARVRDDVEVTWEFHRLGAVLGLTVDADGTTLHNWFQEWGISQPAEIDFALDTPTTNVRGKCQEVRRAMQRASKGAFVRGVTQVHALCGDSFFDKLINHPLVRDTFLNWAAAQELREAKDFDSFPFGGIVFHNYRGADDFSDSAVKGIKQLGIPSTKAKFFPVRGRSVFQVAWAPGESFAELAMPGQPIFPKIVRDLHRDQWVDVEEYSYPLFMCMRPEMLQRAREAA